MQSERHNGKSCHICSIGAQAPAFVRLLANHDKVSKGSKRSDARLFFPHPASQILLGLAFDVIPQLFVELHILRLRRNRERSRTGIAYSQFTK